MKRGQLVKRKLVNLCGTIGMLITLGLIIAQPVFAEQNSASGCTLATLTGSYVFDGTGFTMNTAFGQPKAIVEFVNLNGDGTLTSLATVSIGGAIHRGIPGSGTYTVADNCTGTLTFTNGPHFDLFIAPSGDELHMIQTDTGTVLAAVARRVSP